MKILRLLFAATLAAVSVVTALAADATPAGTWKWTANGPLGPIEVTGKFEFKDGQLTGTVAGPNGNAAPIVAASFKDGLVVYTVVRELQGTRFEVHYSGRLEGDTITGKIDRPVPDGEREQVEWKAARAM